MDEADSAQIINDYFLAESLKKAKESLSDGPSAFYCTDCEEPIPEARRRHVPGCTRCTECQAAAERRPF